MQPAQIQAHFQHTLFQHMSCIMSGSALCVALRLLADGALQLYTLVLAASIRFTIPLQHVPLGESLSCTQVLMCMYAGVD